MEINHIEGFKLIEIRKTGDKVNLFFKRLGHNQKVELSFKGLLFETSTQAINKQVETTYLDETLGFKAISQLRYLHLEPSNYKQLLVQMKGSTEEYKIELICVFEDYKLVQHKHRGTHRTHADLPQA